MIKKILIVGAALALLGVTALIIYLVCGHDNSLTLREYDLESDKIENTVKIAFIADLHGTEFGDNNCVLVDMINSSEPDIVLLGGDMFDEELRIEPSKSFIAQITKLYSVYAVMGNHEYKTKGHSSSELKQLYRDLGVVLLENESITVDIGGEKLNICGTDPSMENPVWPEQTVENADRENYTLVINHRPDQWTELTDKDIDLMLSGHAHGGQWIVPGLFNGILAPNQGFLPKYAGGLYELEDGMTLIVSRGLALANTVIPRAYNPPELVLITVN